MLYFIFFLNFFLFQFHARLLTRFFLRLKFDLDFFKMKIKMKFSIFFFLCGGFAYFYCLAELWQGRVYLNVLSWFFSFSFTPFQCVKQAMYRYWSRRMTLSFEWGYLLIFLEIMTEFFFFLSATFILLFSYLLYFQHHFVKLMMKENCHVPSILSVVPYSPLTSDILEK